MVASWKVSRNKEEGRASSQIQDQPKWWRAGKDFNERKGDK